MTRKISNQELERMIKIILYEPPLIIDEIIIKKEWKKLKKRIEKWEQSQRNKKLSN